MLFKLVYINREKTTCCILLGTFFWLLGLLFTSSVKLSCPTSAELVTSGTSQLVMVRLLAFASVKIERWWKERKHILQ